MPEPVCHHTVWTISNSRTKSLAIWLKIWAPARITTFTHAVAIVYHPFTITRASKPAQDFPTKMLLLWHWFYKAWCDHSISYNMIFYCVFFFLQGHFHFAFFDQIFYFYNHFKFSKPDFKNHSMRIKIAKPCCDWTINQIILSAQALYGLPGKQTYNLHKHYMACQASRHIICTSTIWLATQADI